MGALSGSEGQWGDEKRQDEGGNHGKAKAITHAARRKAKVYKRKGYIV